MRMDKLTSKFQMALAEAQSLAVGRDQADPAVRIDQDCFRTVVFTMTEDELAFGCPIVPHETGRCERGRFLRGAQGHDVHV